MNVIVKSVAGAALIGAVFFMTGMGDEGVYNKPINIVQNSHPSTPLPPHTGHQDLIERIRRLLGDDKPQEEDAKKATA